MMKASEAKKIADTVNNRTSEINNLLKFIINNIRCAANEGIYFIDDPFINHSSGHSDNVKLAVLEKLRIDKYEIIKLDIDGVRIRWDG